MGVHDHFAGKGIELAARQSLSDLNGLCGFFHQARPPDVTTHDADDAIADLFGVDEYPHVAVQEFVQFGVERLEIGVEVVLVERPVAVRQLQFVVVVQVARRRDDRDNAPEAVLA